MTLSFFVISPHIVFQLDFICTPSCGDSCLNQSKIRPLKMHDCQTESSMILVWFSELIQARHLEFKTALIRNKIIQHVV